MPIREQIENGSCGCERFVIARDAVNGDTIACHHTAECYEKRNKPAKGPVVAPAKPHAEPKKVPDVKAKAKK